MLLLGSLTAGAVDLVKTCRPNQVENAEGSGCLVPNMQWVFGQVGEDCDKVCANAGARAERAWRRASPLLTTNKVLPPFSKTA